MRFDRSRHEKTREPNNEVQAILPAIAGVGVNEPPHRNSQHAHEFEDANPASRRVRVNKCRVACNDVDDPPERKVDCFGCLRKPILRDLFFNGTRVEKVYSHSEACAP